MFQLTDNEKLGVVCVCLGLLAATIVATVCALAPSCCLHVALKALAKRRRHAEEGRKLRITGSPSYTVECYREDSTYSSMSSSTQSPASVVSNYSEVSLDASIIDTETNYGQVTFSAWCRIQDNRGDLVVALKEAQDLSPRCYGGVCDPYLSVQLVRDKKRWSKKATLYEFRTKTKKKTLSPIFKESFVMAISKSDLKDASLRIQAFDADKYANDSVLGEVNVPLKEITLVQNHSTTLDLREPRADNGEILFGLSYLPTAERLTFCIAKAHNLKITTDDLDSFSPYIRILLIHNGKVVKKKKTTPRPATASPVFHETLPFDLPAAQLDHVLFIVVASHRVLPDGRATHLGKVVVGAGAKGLGLTHWRAMQQAPRKQVTQWHRLT